MYKSYDTILSSTGIWTNGWLLILPCFLDRTLFHVNYIVGPNCQLAMVNFLSPCTVFWNLAPEREQPQKGVDSRYRQ